MYALNVTLMSCSSVRAELSLLQATDVLARKKNYKMSTGNLIGIGRGYGAKIETAYYAGPWIEAFLKRL
jgi:hypothetical protein